METLILPVFSPESFERAVSILTASGVAAFPTDTVYGLGALAFNAQAIDLLYAVKGRDSAKAIAVLLGKNEDLEKITYSMNRIALRLAECFWPGPLTLVVPRSPDLPDNLSPLPTIGVRIPDHPAAIKLLSRCGPMAVTSANLSGKTSPTTAEEVSEQLGGLIPLILDGGRTPGGRSSTVVDCTGAEPIILRQGPITLEEMKAVL